MDALFVLPVLTSLAVVAIGVFLLARPSAAIEIQRQFYEKINWRIQPISMAKEIGNTRLMGVFLIAAAVGTIVVIVTGLWGAPAAAPAS